MMKFHPLSELFPLLEGAAFEELVADVRRNGVLEPVWLYQGQVLDGRNRMRAAEIAGREALTREYTGDEPLKFVLSLNLYRRHLTESQRSIIATRIPTLKEGRPLTETASNEAVSQADAARMMKVSRSSVQRARKVIEQAAPEVVQAVERGEVRLNAAQDIAKAPKEEQVAAIAAGKQGVKQLRKKIQGSAAQVAPKRERETRAQEAAEHLLSFVRAVESKLITPKLIRASAPLWIFERGSGLMKFLGKCVALAKIKRREIERRHAAWRKKSAAAAKAAKKKLRAQAAKKKAAAAARKLNARKPIRTGKAHVRKAARVAKSAKTLASRRARGLRDARVSA